jgi:hypothetical protein
VRGRIEIDIRERQAYGFNNLYVFLSVTAAHSLVGHPHKEKENASL